MNSKSFLLLKTKETCPACRRRRSFTDGHCSGCGMRLFIRPINFAQYEADGCDRRYWLWTNDRGWIHRDVVMDPKAEPLDQCFEITTTEKNTKSVTERISEVKQDISEKKKRILPKRNQFGYGKSKTIIAGH